jgi:glucose-6-phosphate isomerase
MSQRSCATTPHVTRHARRCGVRISPMDRLKLWQRYNRYLCRCSGTGLTLDVSRMDFPPALLTRSQPMAQAAYDAMKALESGAIANPDEKRMVGHYWLRSPDLAPTAALRKQITDTIEAVATFARDVHAKRITPPRNSRFTDLLVVGIGGSALGPQLVADALAARRDKLKPHFLDNTDPDGMARVIDSIGNRLKTTLVLVISKSGGTKETRNGMIEVQKAFEARGLEFPPQAVAITGEGSALDKVAQKESWLRRFPMWDWVGGRTSVLSAVGLLPAALQGVDIKGLLNGAAAMDRVTRRNFTGSIKNNPALLMALMWHHASGGRGAKDLVMLPYKDRLLLMSRYLQQLIMESLGKEHDLDGNVVNQGLSVYGNKGSTDQHAYVQQLRDGVHNFFATFIVVQQDAFRTAREGKSVEVEPGVTSGDYLHGFWQGTREALAEKGRESMTIFIDKLDARRVGALIALYERAVGYYATMVNINAYHQPGVESGKKAAETVLAIQGKVVAHMRKHPGQALDAQQIAEGIGSPDHVETVHHVLEHLAANKRFVARERRSYIYHG